MIRPEKLVESTTRVDDLLLEALAEPLPGRGKLLAQAMDIACDLLRQIAADPFVGQFAELTGPQEIWGEQVRQLMQEGAGWQEIMRTEGESLLAAGLRERVVEGLLEDVAANYQQYRDRLITPAELEQSFQRLEGLFCGRAEELAQQAEFAEAARGLMQVLGGALMAVIGIADVESLTPPRAGVSCTLGAGLIREGTQTLLNEFLPV